MMGRLDARRSLSYSTLSLKLRDFPMSVIKGFRMRGFSGHAPTRALYRTARPGRLRTHWSQFGGDGWSISATNCYRLRYRESSGLRCMGLWSKAVSSKIVGPLVIGSSRLLEKLSWGTNAGRHSPQRSNASESECRDSPIG